MAQTSQEIAHIVNDTVTNSTITFQQAIDVTTNPYFFVPILILTGSFILLFVIWGAIASARTTTGEKIPGTSVIQSINFWIIFIMLILFFASIFLLTIFPFWLKFI